MKAVVVGAGVAGLTAAYLLAKAGVDVEVFERKYVLYGASGRNSGGLTAQFNDEKLVRLALRSLQLYDDFQSEIGFNFLLRKDGYLKLSNDRKSLEEEVKFQRKLGVKVDLLEPSDVKNIFPDINTETFKVASFFRDGGVVFPWPVLWGLAKGCKEHGAKIHEYKPVKVVVENGRVVGVKSEDGLVKADIVINAAGAWSNEISREAGVELNNKIVKEEICVTESLKPYIGPYILDVTNDLYVSQSMRGEIVGGIIGKEVGEIDVKASLDFLIRYAKRVTKLIPKLRGLSILRQWAGVYDVSENGFVAGKTSVEGFYQLNGFGRRGMSIAPAAAEELVKSIL